MLLDILRFTVALMSFIFLGLSLAVLKNFIRPFDLTNSLIIFGRIGITIAIIIVSSFKLLDEDADYPIYLFYAVLIPSLIIVVIGILRGYVGKSKPSQLQESDE